METRFKFRDLKMLAKGDPLKGYIKRIPFNPRPCKESAFRYLLTNDERLVSPIIQEIKKGGRLFAREIK